MNNMELKVGDLIYARNVAFTEQGFPQLVKGKEYEILEKSDKFFVINSEVSDFHAFSVSHFNSFFTLDPPKKERFFIVFFIGDKVIGSYHISTDGQYINAKEMSKLIKIKEGEKWVVLTNIIELSKTDYQAWIEQ